MASHLTQEKNRSRSGALRTMALISVLTGTGVSFGLTLHAGRHNTSMLLVVLFSGWVLSPFLAMLRAERLAREWPDRARKMTYYIMLIVPIVSLVCYSGLLSPPGTKPAFVFLAVPLVSWVILAIFLFVALKARRPPR